MAQDIRVIVPRVRRAIEGAGAAATLSDDAIKDMVADSIAAIILYTGSAFGKTLTVTSYDTGIPAEYEIDPDTTLPEQTVIAAQAALDYFFFMFRGVKTSESIGDEAQNWSYTLSATLLRDQMKLLIDERDRALQALGADENLVYYESFLHIRDAATADLVESWVEGAGGAGGLNTDYRFAGC